MYFEHFGLDQAPFKITPNQDFFYSGANRGAILDALVYAITSGEGIVKVVGEVGTGKTMLCRMLESRLPDTVEIIYLANPSLPHDEMLYAIVGELGLQLSDQRPTQVLRELQNFLIDRHAQGHQVVAFIDEAQVMPLESLEEIRLLSNLETGTSKLLQIVLFGQPELDQHIDQPHIRQLKERITHSFTLHPFNRKDIAEYVDFRMRTAGYRGPSLFTQGALKLIQRASRGLIRRVNILADKALLAAFSDNTHAITVKQVKVAIRDSGFTPARETHSRKIAALVALAALAIGIWLGNNLQPTPTPQAVPQTPQVQQPVAAPAPPSPPVAAEPENTEPAMAAAEPAPKEEAVSPPPAPAPSPLQQKLDDSRAWIEQQKAEHFTIQLMLVPHEAAESELERIKNQAKLDAGQIHLYATHVGGKPAISIITGAYPSTREARDILAALPEALRNSQPLLRTFKGIREETQ